MKWPFNLQNSQKQVFDVSVYYAYLYKINFFFLKNYWIIQNGNNKQ